MSRIFTYDGREFPDPDPKIPVEEVRRQLAEFFPELTNADTRESKRGADTLYAFAKRIGTKGSRRRPNVATILRRTAEKRLAVFDLATELLGPECEIDPEAAAAREPQINLALAEAEAYARATRQAVEALRRLSAR